jgi:predicted phage-related endonuclease
MEEKIKQYLQLKLKMKDLENAVKFLETEIRDEIKDSIKMD